MRMLFGHFMSSKGKILLTLFRKPKCIRSKKVNEGRKFFSSFTSCFTGSVASGSSYFSRSKQFTMQVLQESQPSKTMLEITKNFLLANNAKQNLYVPVMEANIEINSKCNRCFLKISHKTWVLMSMYLHLVLQNREWLLEAESGPFWPHSHFIILLFLIMIISYW